jgi:hypothetical protein
MQKILTYLYPNRIELLANLTGFTVEYTNVYQKNVKIYNGIDNTLEFDVKNSDQKRIDLSTLTSLELNLMDATGNALPNSPYTINTTAYKGIGKATIPQEDLVDLSEQYLKFSVTATKDGEDVILYTDSKFGAVGTIELIGSALPTFRDAKTFDTFTAEIDLKGQPTYHSSAIPTKFYEAIATTTLDFEIHVAGFIGSIWIDATENSTINSEAWKKGGKPFGSWTRTIEDGPFTGVVPYGSNLAINRNNYFRLSFECPTINGVGSSFTVTRSNNEYNVTVKSGGTGYAMGSQILVPGDQLGGTSGIHDLLITVTHVDATTAGYTSSYAVSSITSITWTGTAQSGTGVHLVSGNNVAGLVEKVIVS